MAKFLKISADEARAKVTERGLSVRDTDKGPMIGKGTSAPASWDGMKRSGRFVMSSQAVDRYGDIIVQQGLNVDRFMTNPAGLLFHSSRDWPIGTWSNLEKVLRGRPPRTEGDLNLLPSEGPVQQIDQAAWMIEHGGLRAVSIGFIPNWDAVESIRNDEDMWTGFQFNESELIECSLVCIPANPDALAKDAAQPAMKLAKDLIEDILDNYQRTPEGLVIPRAAFEKLYAVMAKEADPEPRLRKTIGESLRAFFTKTPDIALPPSEAAIIEARAKSKAVRERLAKSEPV